MASNVGAITNSGAEFEGIFFNLGTAIDLSTDQTITMNFWAEAAIDVLVKLEEGTGADTEISASHGGSGWEMLSFDFTSTDSFSRFTMFVDGPGTTAGTFYLDDIAQMGSTGGGDTPTEAAPAPPSRDAADVISLFSNEYTDITVDTFFAGFSAGAGVVDMQVAGDDVKQYADLDFAGIETIATSVDLSMMTNFHMDVWTATGFDFIAGVVDFGGDGFAGANPDTRGDERTTLQAGMWTSIDVSIADLQAAGLTATPSDFSQLILDVVDVVGTVYVDNIYFYNESSGGGDMPTVAAPAPPSRDAADVISLFSNEYTDITVDTFFAGFSAGGGVSDVQVAGDDTKLYTDLDFAGIETIATSVDLSMMTNFHMDVWTATGFDFIAGVVDFGGDGFAGTNPDTRGDERTTLQAGMWTSIDVSIADLQAAGLTATPTDFSQLILDVVDVIGTVYVDNIYFYNDGAAGGDTPTVAAPAPPARDAADVISLFSNVYTDITVDTFYAGFSAGGGVMDVQVAGDDTKLYTDLDFAGIETIATSVDLSMMTNFHIDVWTATGFDFITGVVDFGGDGFAGANPDTRGDERTTLSAGMWTSIDVSIADLQAAGLTATPTDFSQLILDVVDVLGTVYVDNIYFYKEAAAPPAPATSLPVNFESNETLSGVFEEGDGVTGQPIANPDASGINTSATVYEFDKVLNAAWYSGMFNIFPSDIDSGAGTTFKVKIWSPKAGINVRMQLEKEGNQGPIVTYNLDQTLTTANSWQELTFDFSSTPLNLADGYDKIVIFPDFDDVGQPAGDGSVYYIDDIIQE